MNAERREVMFLGKNPGVALRRELQNRGCSLSVGAIGSGSIAFDRLRAVVASLPPGDPSALCEWINRNNRALADYGVRLEIVAPDDATLGSAQALASDAIRLPNVSVRTVPTAPLLAESIARHRTGNAPRMNLDITVADNREQLRKIDEPLFRRAFSHCSRVTLVELGGGRSDARVFAAYMVVLGSDSGIWPQPAFVKLDRNDKIEREYRNYRDYAERYVPFGLRPNVQSPIRGGERSLLVGDFVDDSESLWDLVRRGVASQAVTSLVDETLRGWWDQGYANDPISGSLAMAMKTANLWDPDKIVASYPEKAAEEGVEGDPSLLREKLFALPQRWRRAPIHGDLHGENVRVRNGQAILIDMANVGPGPVSADLAALETWLAFELPPGVDEGRFGDPAWQHEIDRLFTPDAFRHPPGPCEPSSSLRWMARVVRQIRTMGIAVQSCPTEYQTAIAVQLLRRCMWANGPNADRYRRGYGYQVAVRLIDDACARVQS